MKQVRVLVIDDSLTMRRLIRLALTADPRIEVVGEACNSLQARQKIAELRPGVLTLDVEMPDETGLAFLEWLMAVRPMPVVMVSADTYAGSAAAIEALALGAVDCAGKPANSETADGFSRLPEMVVAAATACVRARPARTQPCRAIGPPLEENFVWNGRHLVIGASTGGVDALERLLARFPANCPPTLVTQHMPAAFLASLAQRLDRHVAPRVTLARDGAPLRPGQVHIAPGGAAHLTIAGAATPACRLEPGERINGHCPSVDVLFHSAASLRHRAIGVLLTGMGRDGAAGLLKMRQAGATCFAQDRDSSVVWGMPRAAIENGAAERALPIDELGPEILLAASRVPGEDWAGISRR